MEQGTLIKKEDLKKLITKKKPPPPIKPKPIIKKPTTPDSSNKIQDGVKQSPPGKVIVADSPTRKPLLSQTSSAAGISPANSPVKVLLQSPAKALPDSPVKIPLKSPLESPLKSLLKSPGNSPAKSLGNSPAKSPTKSPVKLPAGFNIMKQMSAMATVVKAAGKFRKSTVKYNFNFEKFLSYLENMRPVVGFQILKTIVTWDLVSTIIFLLFSILAVFVQESIFGSSKTNSHTSGKS